MEKKKVKIEKGDTVIISDIHLGSQKIRVKKLYNFLNDLLDISPKRLIINGDLFEFWSANYRKIGPEEYRIIRKFLELSQNGIKLVYIPGNHDRAFRGFRKFTIGKVKIRNEYVVKSNGKRFLVVHGDEFDAFIRNNIVVSLVLDKFYYLLIKFNSFWKKILLLNNPISTQKYSSHYRKVTEKIKKAALAYARSRNMDGIVIGHTHWPEIFEDQKNILYINSGDWIESRSYAVIKKGSAFLGFWD